MPHIVFDKDNDYLESNIVSAIDKLSTFCYEASLEKGFYDNPVYNNDATKQLLFVEEIIEAFQAIRHNTQDLPSSHVIEITQLEEEIADLIIRVMDYAAWRKLRLGYAIVKKLEYNQSREYKHGKQF